MRIISYNVNGIRAALKKGFYEWLQTDPADIICVQETKAHKENVDHKLITDLGFHDYWYSAQKKGYSGVAVFTKIKPDLVQLGNGYMQSDAEGRVMRLDFGGITLVNAYFPAGVSGEVRLAYKYVWLNELIDYLKNLLREKPSMILCGDYNIAHKEIDLHDPKRNVNNSGFLPDERAWMDKLFSIGFTDAFREVNPDPHQYSWWSNFNNARDNNKGWRLDYINITQNLKKAIRHASIMPHIRHSDHCPVYLELEI